MGGKGEPGEGKKEGKGNGGDKSPAWSSQDLGSTDNALYHNALYHNALTILCCFATQFLEVPATTSIWL